MKKRKTKQIIFISLKIFIIFCLLGSSIFVYMNFYIIYFRLKYILFSNYSNENSEEIVDIKNENIVITTEEEKTEDRILISKINIEAPIIWTDNLDNMKEDLKSGVAFYPGSQKPDEIGNTVMLGHSSRQWWNKGEYDYIFVNLSELLKGDIITTFYKNKKYEYKVSDKKVLSSDKEEVESEIFRFEDGYHLTLITCTPVGTNFKRLLIEAELQTNE